MQNRFFDWCSICRHTRDMSFRVCGRARVLGYEQQLSCYSRWYFLGHEFVSYWVRLTGWLLLGYVLINYFKKILTHFHEKYKK